MMSSFNEVMDFLYSPLSRKWCLFYYILAVISFVMFVIVFAGAFSKLMTSGGSRGSRAILTGVAALLAVTLPVFLGYFQARLMYSLCDASLK